MTEDVVIASSKLGTKEYPLKLKAHYFYVLVFQGETATVLSIRFTEVRLFYSWDAHYQTELKNYEEFEDEGEVWFGASSENRIVNYVTTSKTDKNARIIDLGCGNGSILRKLRRKGFRSLTGVDYSDSAVKLSSAASEAEKEELEEPCEDILFERLDILAPSPEYQKCDFDMALDKGTWDAMSLSEDRDERAQGYIRFCLGLLRSGGRLVIMSCNFTEKELESRFHVPGTLHFTQVIPASKTFSFGGKEGVTSAGAVFTKV